jgi:hypothetical protein
VGDRRILDRALEVAGPRVDRGPGGRITGPCRRVTGLPVAFVAVSVVRAGVIEIFALLGQTSPDDLEG